jgi:structure-specific endonuclease subunit SLX1
MWVVYCISFGAGEKTYVGATNNFQRRLRQHNGELVGGAKYTTAAIASSKQTKDWKLLFIVRGFPSSQAALQFEWALKHETLRHRSERNLRRRRILALESLLQKDRVTSNAELLSSWPLMWETAEL